MLSIDLKGFAERIRECNTGLEELPTLTPFFVCGVEVGKLKPGFVKVLQRFADVFQTVGPVGPSGRVEVAASLTTTEQRSAAVAAVLAQLRAEGVISGWRDELYPVVSAFTDEPVLLVERAAATHFGIKAYGVHVNGYVKKEDGLHIWVARRSMTKANWPGKLDHLVAGGQPHGLSPCANVVKECGEEAGVGESLAWTAVPVGAVSYLTISNTGYKPDVLFCYDLLLPEDFVPKAMDGEVESFQLWPVSRVAEVVSTTTEFKTNCCLVIIDFLIRHGQISPSAPGYLQLVSGLRTGQCS
ncbi:MAG: hypothetical protein WDW38_009278 [Sanguina aurantia]